MSSDLFGRLRRFLRELKRRKVYRVAAVYAAVAFVVVQAANLVFPALEIPSWAYSLVVVLALLGFPLAVVLAWAFEVTPEGVRRTPEAEPAEKAEAPEAGTSTAYKVLVGLGLVAAAVAGGWYLTGGGSSTPEPIVPGVEELDSSRVAVFPFAVRGDENLAHWSEGMVELLSRSLTGAGSLRAVDPNTLLSRVPNRESEGLSPDSIRRTAARLGAGRYVRGSVYRLGDSLRLSATWYRTDGGRMGSAEVTGGGEAEIQSMVDDLARLAMADLAGEGVSPRQRLAAQTTSSVEALKAYLEGQQALRAFDFPAAVTAFSEAIKRDSSFALAHHRLSVATGWEGGNLRRAYRSAQRAAELAKGLPQRDRRLLRAHAAMYRGDAQTAERLYRDLLERHPNDFEAWYWLGEVTFHFNPVRGRSPLEAEEHFRTAMRLNPSFNQPLLHRPHLALLERDTARFDSLTRRPERRNLAPPIQILFRVARSYVLAGGPDSKLQGRLRDAASPVYSVWSPAVWLGTGGDLAAMNDLLGHMTTPSRSPEVRAAGLVTQAYLRAAQGRLQEARQRLDSVAPLDSAAYWIAHGQWATYPFMPDTEAWSGDHQELRRGLRAWDATQVPERLSPLLSTPREFYPMDRLYVLGLLQARAGEYVEAMKTADRVAEADAPLLAPSGPADLAHSIRAEVKRRRADPEGALSELNGIKRRVALALIVPPIQTGARERYLRAKLLAEQGRPKEALKWYRTLNGLFPMELPYVAPAHLGRARVLAGLGRTEEAIRHYRRFIDLWQDADSILQPKVKEARNALSRLNADTAATSTAALGGSSQ